MEEQKQQSPAEQAEQQEAARRLAETAAAALEDKKGLDVRVMAVAGQTALADYFVIATGTSNTHVHALADEVEFRIKQDLGTAPSHIEGYRNNIWELMDYGSVVVHIFTAEARAFYHLERLWGGTPAAGSDPNQTAERNG